VIRTQIQLTESQARALRAMASARGVSMAELIRQSLGVLLEEEESARSDQRRRALAAVGRFHSGQSDVSERHDDYLAEDFLA
jgi:hypothetical protein